MRPSSTSKNAQAPAPQGSLHFYKNGHLATEVATQGNRHVLWANDVALAQLEKLQTAGMLRVDLANSVLGSASESVAYSPYGYLATDKLRALLLEFNGQWRDSRTHSYPLGSGRRMYNPALMRFCNSDSLSPFEKGGLNSYAYCEGDPANRYDPTGQSGIFNRPRIGRSPSLSFPESERPAIARKLSLPDVLRVEDWFDEQSGIDRGGWFKLAAKKTGMTRAKKYLRELSGNAPSNEPPPNRPSLPEYYSTVPQPHALTRDSLRPSTQNTEQRGSGSGLSYSPQSSAFGYSSKRNDNFAAKVIGGIVGGGTFVGLVLHFGLKEIRGD